MAWPATAPNVTAVDRQSSAAPAATTFRNNAAVIVLAVAIAAADFREPMHSRKERNLILDPDEFYILASKGAVQVLPDYSAEMVPFDPLVGEFRVYYAGSSATRAPAGAGRARFWRYARARYPSSSSMARSSAGSFTRECWSDLTRSTASASARTTKRRGSSYPSISEPERAKSSAAYAACTGLARRASDSSPGKCYF